MASFQDYVKEDDNLEAEINDADQQTIDRKKADNQLPPKFEGKTAEEIASSYAELEQRFSQQGNTLSDMRKALDDHILRRAEPTEPTPEATPVSLDDLYEDPDKAVRQVVEDATNARIAELEAKLAQTQAHTSVQALRTQFPNWETDVQHPDFQEWINQSPLRKRAQAQISQNDDVELAAEVLSEYYAGRQARTDAAKTKQRDTDLSNATLESGGAESVATDQVFSRRELMDIRLEAKRGNAEAANWLSDNADAIAVAYEEGHITD